MTVANYDAFPQATLEETAGYIEGVARGPIDGGGPTARESDAARVKALVTCTGAPAATASAARTLASTSGATSALLSRMLTVPDV